METHIIAERIEFYDEEYGQVNGTVEFSLKHDPVHGWDCYEFNVADLNVCEPEHWLYQRTPSRLWAAALERAIKRAVAATTLRDFQTDPGYPVKCVAFNTEAA